MDNKTERVKIDYEFKILTIGDSAVGKTSIIKRFETKKFPLSEYPTIGVDFLKKYINVDDKVVKLQVWDTAGQERFRCLTKNYYRNANGIILVFDMNDISTYNKLDRWCNDIKENKDDVPVILVGNKKDLIDDFENKKHIFEEFASQNDWDFFFVSAKKGTNINLLFHELAVKMINKCEVEETTTEQQSDSPLTARRFCCF